MRVRAELLLPLRTVTWAAAGMSDRWNTFSSLPYIMRPWTLPILNLALTIACATNSHDRQERTVVGNGYQGHDDPDNRAGVIYATESVESATDSSNTLPVVQRPCRPPTSSRYAGVCPDGESAFGADRMLLA